MKYVNNSYQTIFVDGKSIKPKQEFETEKNINIRGVILKTNKSFEKSKKFKKR